MNYEICYGEIKDILRNNNIYFDFSCENLRLKDTDKVVFSKNTKIGNYVAICKGNILPSMGSYTYTFSTLPPEITVGRYCSIARGLAFLGNDHPIHNVSTSPFTYSNKHFLLQKPFTDQHTKNLNKIIKEVKGGANGVVIKNDVWIGENVTIKHNVTIGNGAIVGGCSFVTKDVPDFAVVGGCPARIIKYRFTQDIINQLEESEWWKYELPLLNNYHFDKPEEFLKVFQDKKNNQELRLIEEEMVDFRRLFNRYIETRHSLNNVSYGSIFSIVYIQNFGPTSVIKNDVVFETDDQILDFDLFVCDDSVFKVSKLLCTSDCKYEWHDFYSKNLSSRGIENNSSFCLNTHGYLAGIRISISKSNYVKNIYYRFKLNNNKWSKVYKNGEEAIFNNFSVVGLHIAAV